ncbi:MAG: ferritin [Treponema sp.]|nr:ferritin [Candidatus Treponema equifaecale]
MKKEIFNLLNTQVQKEFESAYIYLYFASYFDANGLCGFGNWYKMQAQEEISHGMKIYDYLHETDETLRLLPIGAPDLETDSIIQVLEETLEHEEYVTALINTIYAEAVNAHDYRTRNFLEWFISEQREEEAQVQVLIEKYSLFGTEGSGLMLLDKELSKRCK